VKNPRGLGTGPQQTANRTYLFHHFGITTPTYRSSSRWTITLQNLHQVAGYV